MRRDSSIGRPHAPRRTRSTTRSPRMLAALAQSPQRADRALQRRNARAANATLPARKRASRRGEPQTRVAAGVPRARASVLPARQVRRRGAGVRAGRRARAGLGRGAVQPQAQRARSAAALGRGAAAAAPGRVRSRRNDARVWLALRKPPAALPALRGSIRGLSRASSRMREAPRRRWWRPASMSARIAPGVSTRTSISPARARLAVRQRARLAMPASPLAHAGVRSTCRVPRSSACTTPTQPAAPGRARAVVADLAPPRAIRWTPILRIGYLLGRSSATT